MSKFVNARYPVAAALSLCLGVTIGLIIYRFNLPCPLLALAALPFAVIFIVYFSTKRNCLRAILFLLLPFIFFIAGGIHSYYCAANFDKSETNEDSTYKITGKVIEKGYAGNGEYIIIDNIEADGKPLSGKAYVYLAAAYGDYCDVGYYVNFSASLDKYNLFEYGTINRNAEENIKYRASAESKIESTYGFSFFGRIRSKTEKLLYNYLEKDTAAIAFGMLTGNTQRVDEEALYSFRYGGIAHIFAVSGLHIGLIYSVFMFICKRLKLNKYASAVIGVSAVFFYSAVCGFSVSSLRAAIMCLVASVASVCNRRNDGLNSLSIAVIIIICANPFNLFSVGFLLSVCAVGGIFVFSKQISYLLQKIKLPEKLSSAAGVSFGAQIATTPIMLSNFGYLSGAGLLLNLLIIPVLSVVFIIFFFSIAACLFIPAISPYLLPYAALPLEFIMSLFIKAGFEKSIISGFGAGAFSVLYLIGVLAISDKLNLSSIKRAVAIICAIVTLGTYVYVKSCPPRGYQVIISAYSNGGEILIRSGKGAVMIITDDAYISDISKFTDGYYVRDIDSIIIVGDSAIQKFNDLNTDAENIYIFDDGIQLQPYGQNRLTYTTSFSSCGVDFDFIGSNRIDANIDGIKFTVCSSAKSVSGKCDIYISDFRNSSMDCGVEVYFNNNFGALSVKQCGDIIFSVRDGKYYLDTTIPPENYPDGIN